MGNHPFNLIVVLFWLTTMSWLFVAKVLPSMRVGEPPSYQSILAESEEQAPACWRIRLEDEPIGWAANKLHRRNDGITELYSRVYLRDLPLDELAPGWLANVLKPLLRDLGPLDIDKWSRMVVDPLGRLVGFESRVRIGDLHDVIKVRGQIEGSVLKLTVQSGEIPHKIERYLPSNALMTDELSPQTRMPNLRVGQSWTVPLYSPFLPPTNPVEILQARVERSETLTWHQQRVPSKLVVYRGDPGSGLSSDKVRGRLWVGDDGAVLQQEVMIRRSRLYFVRLPDAQATKMATELGPDWTGVLPNGVANDLLRAASGTAP
jgi:hypothetical protein